jgi:WD40 repeat protein
VYTGGYDGSVVVHGDALQTVASVRAHSGPIKCLATMENESGLMIATRSLDQTLVTHHYDSSTKTLEKHANFVGGHTSSIGCVDMLESQHRMVSGDWDGGLALWDLSSSNEGSERTEEPVKKRKTSSKSKNTVLDVRPLTKFQAHSSQISGASWTSHYSQLGSHTQSVECGTARKSLDVEWVTRHFMHGCFQSFRARCQWTSRLHY